MRASLPYNSASEQLQVSEEAVQPNCTLPSQGGGGRYWRRISCTGLQGSSQPYPVESLTSLPVRQHPRCN
jgi:hypothetical protein